MKKTLEDFAKPNQGVRNWESNWIGKKRTINKPCCENCLYVARDRNGLFLCCNERNYKNWPVEAWQAEEVRPTNICDNWQPQQRKGQES